MKLSPAAAPWMPKSPRPQPCWKTSTRIPNVVASEAALSSNALSGMTIERKSRAMSRNAAQATIGIIVGSEPIRPVRVSESRAGAPPTSDVRPGASAASSPGSSRFRLSTSAESVGSSDERARTLRERKSAFRPTKRPAKPSPKP